MKKRTEATLWAVMACLATMGGMWSYGEYRTFDDMGINTTTHQLLGQKFLQQSMKLVLSILAKVLT